MRKLRQARFQHSRSSAWAALIGLTLIATSATSQELNPRVHWPAPKGLQLVTLGFTYNSGNVLTDRALPLGDVDNETNMATLLYYGVFSLAGRTANVTIQLPGARSRLDARLSEDDIRRRISGFADMQARIGVNLIGAPSMTGQEFQEFRQDPPSILGASLQIVAPTGSYNEDKVVNLGSNRWAAKPEIGYLIPTGRWVLEFSLGAWFFGDNDGFVGGTLEEDPITALEFHLVRRIKPGLWASLDLNFYSGGRTTVSGIGEIPDSTLDNRQENSRIGATLLFPFQHRHAVRFAFSTGLTTESGSDFDSVSLSYSFAWP